MSLDNDIDLISIYMLAYYKLINFNFKAKLISVRNLYLIIAFTDQFVIGNEQENVQKCSLHKKNKIGLKNKIILRNATRTTNMPRCSEHDHERSISFFLS